MMGFKVEDLNVPVIKSTNGIIAIEATCKRGRRVHKVRPLHGRMSHGA
jgi:Na+-translocating ferredoxin:NAD+ oxidoreductase RnfC subunit